MTFPAKRALGRAMTRRQFARRSLMAASVIAGAPAFLRGQNLNNKLNIAFIACGGRANASLGELTIVPGRTAVKGGRAGSATAISCRRRIDQRSRRA